MKKVIKHLFVLSMLLLATTGMLSAQQSTVTVGNWSGTAKSTLTLINGNYRHSYNQVIITASDMGGAQGYIRAVVLDNRSTLSRTFDSVRLFLGPTTKATFDATNDWEAASNLRQVYNGTNFVIPAETGELVIVLDTAYYYSGSGNLILCMAKDQPSYSSSMQLGYTSTTNTALYKQNDNDFAYSRPGTTAGTRGSYKPNVKFIMTANANDALCMNISGFGLTALDEQSITVGWDSLAGVSYEVAIVEASQNTAVGDLTTTQVVASGYTFTGLAPNTSYRIYARTLCGGTTATDWDSLTAATSPVPVSLPFLCTFEDSTYDSQWVLRNVDMAHSSWMIGDSAFAGDAATGRSLYITAGTSGANIYSNTQTTSVFAGVLLGFTAAGSYDVQFDWRAMGTSTVSYMRALLIPAQQWADYQAGTAAVTGLTATATPGGFIAVDGGGKLNLQAGWQQLRTAVEVPAAGNYYLCFYWVNTTAAVANPPAAVDNIMVQQSTCVRPTSCSITGIDATSATLNIVHPDASQFIMGYRAVGSTIIDTVDITGTTYTFTGLQPGTDYEGIVYSHCGGDTSFSGTAFSFTTECAVLSLPVAFGAEEPWGGTASAPQLNCWAFINNGSTTYNWRQGSTTTPHSGSRCYYYYGTTSTTYVYDDWMITPEIEFTGNDAIQLWVRTSSATTTATYHGHIALYATDDGASQYTDTAHFHRLDISGAGVTNNMIDFVGNTWQQITVALPNTLTDTHRLALVVNTQSYTFYVDDIYIYHLSSCPTVATVTVDGSSITTDGADIHWTDTASTGTFEFSYWPEGAAAGDTVTVPVADTSLSLTGLTPNTLYYVSVVAVCPGERSIATYPVSFRTLCTAIPDSQLPYTETFETYTTGSANPISPCWYKATNSSTAYPYPYTSAAINSGMGLYFYSTATYYSYAVLPTFESDVNELMVEFDLKRNGTSTYKTTLVVGVMSDAGDLRTMDTVDVIDITSETVNSIHHFAISLESYAGTGTRIVLLAPYGITGTNYVYLDNVMVSRLPDCRWPVDLAVDTATSTSATLTWYGTSTDFQVQYARNADFTQGLDSLMVQGDTTTTITGLLPYTAYYARVRSVCSGGEYSGWSNTVGFRTSIDCGTDYEESQVHASFGASTSGTYLIYSQPGSDGSYVNPCLSWHLYTPTELMDLELLDTANIIHSIMLETAVSSGVPHPFRMWMAESPLESFASIADTIARSNMQLVFDGSYTFDANAWNEIPLDSSFRYTGQGSLIVAFERVGGYVGDTRFKYGSLQSGTNRLAYKYSYSGMYGNSTSASTTYLYHFNIGFRVCKHVPLCAAPTGMEVVSLAYDTVRLAWHGTANNYNIMVSPTPVQPDTVSPGNALLLTTTDTTIALTGLTQGTTYYYYLQSVCGSDITDWTLARNFKVPCAPQPLPYTENFDSYPASTSAAAGQTISPCWTKGTSSATAYPYLYTTNSYSAPNGMYFYATTTAYSYAALPRMADSVHNLVLTFMLKKTSANYGKMRIGVMTDPGDISTFVYYKSAVADVVSIWEAKEIDFSGYTGPEGYIAFLLPDSATNNAIIDDIVVDLLPTCRHVENVQVSNITSTTAVVKWTDPMNATNHEIEYGPRGFVPGTGTTVTSTADSVVLTGLPIGERMSVSVRTICSAADTSAWSMPVVFNTECAPLPLPIIMDFENETSGSGNTVEQSLCWRRLNNTGSPTATYAYYPYINTGTNSHGGNKHLYYYYGTTSSYPTDIAYVTPEIDTLANPINQVELSFWAKRSTNPCNLVVGVMTNQGNSSTFVPVDSVDLTTDYRQYFVSLTNYTGHGSYIAFRHVRTSTLAEYVYLDDIAIYRAAPCPRSFNLSAHDATDSSVVLTWSDTIGSTSWHIELTNMATGDMDTIVATDTAFVLTGLTPRTNYSFRVAPVCSDGQVSEYNFEGYRFGTAQVPATVPYSYDFESAAEWANWQTSTSSYIGWYRGNIARGNTSNVMYISADGGATHSWNTNFTSNVLAWRDIDFGSDTGSYTLGLDIYVGGTESNRNGIAVAVVDPTVYVEDIATYYQTPWGHVNDISLAWLRLDTTWGYHTVNIDMVSGVRRVVLYHYTYATTAAVVDNPPAVDNITITRQLCDRPSQLDADSITATTALISWEGNPSASYTIDYRPAGTTGTDQFVTVTGNSGTITNMLPATDYNVWVKKNCTDSLSSTWSSYITITTLCAPISVRDTLRQNFENIEGKSYSVAGNVPRCWDSWHDGTNAITPHVIEATSSTTSYAYSSSGTKSLVFYNYSTTYGQNSVARLAEISEPTNTLTMAFWISTYSNVNGIMDIGYMTGDNYTTDFVTVKSIAASEQTVHSGSGLQPAGHGVFDTVHFDSVPDGNYRIAFRWRSTASSTTTTTVACIDDIAIWSSYSCYPPAIVSAIGDYQSDTVTISGTGIGYQIAYGTTQGNLADTVTVTGNTLVVSGLSQNTTYYYAVRQQCDSTTWSDWTTGSFTTDEMPCMAPTALAVSDTTYSGATLTWTPGPLQNRWVVHTFGTNYDVYDTVAATTYTYTSLVQGATYSVAVRSLCGAEASPWSDTAQFTLLLCSRVTGLAATNIGGTSVSLAWNATGADSYTVVYGYRGMSQSEGTALQVNTNSCIITGLEQLTDYDIYVRGNCTPTVGSVWSDVLQVRTTEGGSDPEYYTVTVLSSCDECGTVSGGGTFAEGTSTVITATGNAGYRFARWDDGNADSIRTIVVTANATYTATFERTTGIDAVEGVSMTLYPNPATSTVTIAVGERAEVSIVDQSGRTVLKAVADSPLNVNVRTLASGTYYVRAVSQSGVAVQKLIVK